MILLAPAAASSRILLWSAFALVAATLVWVVWHSDPVTKFGYTHDDTLYFSTARAIAEGRGNIIASVPGSPEQTKYPPLYPYLLSLVWLAQPSFPENLVAASALSTACTVAVLFLWFLDLRRWSGVGEWIALACVAASAANEYFRSLVAAVMSDMVFAALALLACRLTGSGDDDRRSRWIAVGLVAGMSIAARSVGITVLAGICCFLALRRNYRAAAMVLLGSLPAVAWSALGPSAAPIPEDSLPGWRQTWLYYTDYMGFWRIGVADIKTFGTLVYANIGNLLWRPAYSFLGEPLSGMAGPMIWTPVGVACFAGLARQAKADQLRPVHLVLLFHLPIVLLWNFDISSRLLLMFFPYFCMGFFIEASRVGRGMRDAFRDSTRVASKLVVAAFAAGLVGGAIFLAHHWASERQAEFRSTTISFHKEFAEIVSWIKGRTSPDDRLVAYHHGYLYLETGRQGIWPLAFTTDLRTPLDQERFDRQVSWFADTARQTQARYLVYSEWDYEYLPPMQEAYKKGALALPEVARSASGQVRVFDLQCVQDLDYDKCGAAFAAWGMPKPPAR